MHESLEIHDRCLENQDLLVTCAAIIQRAIFVTVF